MAHPYAGQAKSSQKARLKRLGGSAGKSWGSSSMYKASSLPGKNAGSSTPMTISGGSSKKRPDRMAAGGTVGGGGKKRRPHATTNIIISHAGGRGGSGGGGGAGPEPRPVPVPRPFRSRSTALCRCRWLVGLLSWRIPLVDRVQAWRRPTPSPARY